MHKKGLNDAASAVAANMLNTVYIVVEASLGWSLAHVNDADPLEVRR